MRVRKEFKLPKGKLIVANYDYREVQLVVVGVGEKNAMQFIRCNMPKKKIVKWLVVLRMVLEMPMCLIEVVKKGLEHLQQEPNIDIMYKVHIKY